MWIKFALPIWPYKSFIGMVQNNGELTQAWLNLLNGVDGFGHEAENTAINSGAWNGFRGIFHGGTAKFAL